MAVPFRIHSCAVLALVVSPAVAQSLSLEEALRLGELQSPRLAAQRSAVSATHQQVGRAAALPDPKVRLGIENLPVSGDDRFRYDRDFMTMRFIGVVQEFPNSAKREARNRRAERMRDVEAAGLQTQRALVQRDVALAWLEAHYAERAWEALERLAGQFRLQLEAVPSGIARGRQTAAEGYALRQAFEQTYDRVIEQERLAARARVALAALLGDDAKRPLGLAPDTSKLLHPREHLLSRLSEHPQLRTLNERENLARADADLAKSTAKPDWMLEVGYGHRAPAFDNMITVMFAFDLPWDTGRRQDRDVASRLAEVDQARAMREDARRTYEAELRGWFADFDAATRRIERYEQVVLPLARDRRAAALAAYEGGRGELAGVLEAERAQTDAELSLLQALAERGKAWANVDFVYGQGERR